MCVTSQEFHRFYQYTSTKSLCITFTSVSNAQCLLISQRPNFHKFSPIQGVIQEKLLNLQLFTNSSEGIKKETQVLMFFRKVLKLLYQNLPD